MHLNGYELIEVSLLGVLDLVSVVLPVVMMVEVSLRAIFITDVFKITSFSHFVLLQLLCLAILLVHLEISMIRTLLSSDEIGPLILEV